MDEQNNTKTPGTSDTSTLSRSSLMMQAAAPYLDSNSKQALEMVVRFTDFMEVVEKLRTEGMPSFLNNLMRPKGANNTVSMTNVAQGTGPAPIDTESVLRSIRPYCNPKETALLDKIMNIFNMRRVMQTYQMMQSMMSVMNTGTDSSNSQGSSSNMNPMDLASMFGNSGINPSTLSAMTAAMNMANQNSNTSSGYAPSNNTTTGNAPSNNTTSGNAAPFVNNMPVQSSYSTNDTYETQSDNYTNNFSSDSSTYESPSGSNTAEPDTTYFDFRTNTPTVPYDESLYTAQDTYDSTFTPASVESASVPNSAMSSSPEPSSAVTTSAVTSSTLTSSAVTSSAIASLSQPDFTQFSSAPTEAEHTKALQDESHVNAETRQIERFSNRPFPNRFSPRPYTNRQPQHNNGSMQNMQRNRQPINYNDTYWNSRQPVSDTVNSEVKAANYTEAKPASEKNQQMIDMLSTIIPENQKGTLDAMKLIVESGMLNTK